MNRRKNLVLLGGGCLTFLIFLTLRHPSSLSALEFNKARQDYLYNLEKYQESYSEFVRARGAYVKYKTLSTKEEAVVVGRRLLGQRAELVRTYLIMLRSKITQTPPSDFSQQDDLLKEIDSQIAFFSSYKERAKLVETIEEFNQLSEEFDNQFSSVKKVYRQTLVILLLKKEFLLLKDIEELKNLALSSLKNDLESPDQKDWRENIIQQIEDARSSFELSRKSLLDLEDQNLGSYQFNQQWKKIAYSLGGFKKSFNKALFFLEELVSKLEENGSSQ